MNRQMESCHIVTDQDFISIIVHQIFKKCCHYLLTFVLHQTSMTSFIKHKIEYFEKYFTVFHTVESNQNGLVPNLLQNIIYVLQIKK